MLTTIQEFINSDQLHTVLIGLGAAGALVVGYIDLTRYTKVRHDIMLVLYDVISHKYFNRVFKGVSVLLVFFSCYWYFANFDKIMGTEAGRLQELQEAEEKRDEELRILAGKGVFLLHEVPDLPPYVPEQEDNWEAFTKRLDAGVSFQKLPYTQSLLVERGKSEAFDAALLKIDNVRLVKGRGDSTTGLRVPHLHALVSNKGANPMIEARVDMLFMDGTGQVLARRSVNPLVVSGGLFGDKIRPLQPGESREFEVDTSQLPAGWGSQIHAELVYYRYMY